MSFGRRILQKYNDDISGLIKNWEKHVLEPLPAAPVRKEQSEFEDSGFIDLNFCENISYTLAAVTRALVDDGRADDAIRLFMLNLRFNQFFAGRDGFFMGLLSRLHKDEVDFAVMIDNLFTLRRLQIETFKSVCLNPEPVELSPALKRNETYFRALVTP